MSRWPLGYQRTTHLGGPHVYSEVPAEFRMSAAEVAPVIGVEHAALVHVCAAFRCTRPHFPGFPWPVHLGKGRWAFDRRLVEYWQALVTEEDKRMIAARITGLADHGVKRATRNGAYAKNASSHTREPPC